ncbi:MAG: BTAD domain-containing putative transcriptional regulator [Acidimicrobiales bacterium]
MEDDAATSGVDLSLLGGFKLSIAGTPRAVPGPGQRVLAWLALAGGTQHRRYLAGTLWPDKNERRAGASLRAALWGLRQVDPGLVEATDQSVALGPGVRHDIDGFQVWSDRVIDGRGRLDDLDADWIDAGYQLLPGWYEDWLEPERERTRQRWLHAIEAVVAELLQLRAYARAVNVGLAVVAADPLRESAHRLVILAHLAEGNTVEARRQYERCRHHLDAEIGVEPSPRLTELLAATLTRTGRS